MSLLVLLSLLIFIPFIAYKFARIYITDYIFCISGIAFGVIVTPFSLGLYSWFHVSSLGLIPGMVGLILSIIHGSPGFYLATAFGVINGVDVISSVYGYTVVLVFNIIIWVFIYGLLGYGVDCYRKYSSFKE